MLVLNNRGKFTQPLRRIGVGQMGNVPIKCAAGASESRAALESQLDWLDAKLSDGRFYLAGDRFSRADLTVASLLAGFARPKEMSVYHGMTRPDALAADTERWRSRPAMQWAIEQ
jgi:glutathione S-transferase